MKKSFLLFLIVFSSLTFAQSPVKENIKYLKITQKMCANKKGYQLVLKQVVSDSRCPEGLNCIWAGEASAIISVYKDSKLVEDNTMVFSMKNEQENLKWLANYLPEKQKNLKSVSVFPYPKKGVKINAKESYLKIGFAK